MFIKAAPIGASVGIGKGGVGTVPSAFSAGNVDANRPARKGSGGWAGHLP